MRRRLAAKGCGVLCTHLSCVLCTPLLRVVYTAFACCVHLSCVLCTPLLRFVYTALSCYVHCFCVLSTSLLRFVSTCRYVSPAGYWWMRMTRTLKPGFVKTSRTAGPASAAPASGGRHVSKARGTRPPPKQHAKVGCERSLATANTLACPGHPVSCMLLSLIQVAALI